MWGVLKKQQWTFNSIWTLTLGPGPEAKISTSRGFKSTLTVCFKTESGWGKGSMGGERGKKWKIEIMPFSLISSNKKNGGKRQKKNPLCLRLRILVNDRDKEKVQQPPMATPVVTCGVKKTDHSGCSSPLTSQRENSLPQVTCYFPCPFPNEDALGRSLLLPWLLEKLPHQHSHIHLKTFSTVTHYWTGLWEIDSTLKSVTKKERFVCWCCWPLPLSPALSYFFVSIDMEGLSYDTFVDFCCRNQHMCLWSLSNEFYTEGNRYCLKKIFLFLPSGSEDLWQHSSLLGFLLSDIYFLNLWGKIYQSSWMRGQAICTVKSKRIIHPGILN